MTAFIPQGFPGFTVCRPKIGELYALAAATPSEDAPAFSESYEKSREFSESPTNLSEAYILGSPYSEDGKINFVESYTVTNS